MELLKFLNMRRGETVKLVLESPWIEQSLPREDCWFIVINSSKS